MSNDSYPRFKTIKSYEAYRKKQILNVSLGISGLAVIPMGLSNISRGNIESAISLFIVSFISLVALFLNSKDRFYLSSGLFFFFAYLVIFFNCADSNGLRDEGLIALPIITVMAGLLYGKITSIFLTSVSILGIWGFYHLTNHGLLAPDMVTDRSTPVILSLILVIMGALQYVVMQYWESNIQWLQRSERQVREAYEKTIESWARALEQRDRETEGHSRRVVELSLRVAQELEINDKEEINAIRQGALLHDIGKMAIPDHILLKSGPLDEDEWEIVKQHPELALQMLEHLPLSPKVIEIVMYHHEQWDGKGYPEGLVGEQIPLFARMFTIIDQWDALRSDRPYRKAWNKAEAIRYLEENSGTIFDPGLVPAFLNLLQKNQ
ncbi:MAG: HD-GYP domain-containing protein [Anaerolineales bacterium]|nr:HD-GYP domain-containing protein [Anaerolineales bacterium]